MSTTIGFGYTPLNASDDGFDEIKDLVESHDYGLLQGIECSDPEVRGGVAVAQKIQEWKILVFLESPKDSGSGLAFGIHQELTDFEMKGKRPAFFDFLEQLVILCSKKCSKLGIFFAGEWYENDRIRYSYGSKNDLITLLSMSGHWGIIYLIPETGNLQESNEIPFVFDMKLSK